MMEKEITEELLDKMANVDIRTVDPNTLVDIHDVAVNPALSREERLMDFLRQIRNPFCYRHGKYVVKVSYVDTDVTLEDRMIAYIRSKLQV